MQGNSSNNLVLGGLLAAGMIIGGWVLGAQIKATRLADRYVTVRGLVERTVKSDLAIWTISFKETGNDLPAVYAKTESNQKAILEFLGQQGFKPDEYEVGLVRVVDKQANEYGDNRSATRYLVEQSITVRTSRVDAVAGAAQKTSGLVQRGIALTGGGGQGLAYKFTGLNAIKPDMITEATRNARAAADRFAQDSGSIVGSIKTANQGVFSILPSGQGSSPEEGYGGDMADRTIMKTVRVVTTVEYFLEK